MYIMSGFWSVQVKLDKLVNPNKTVADYRTEITGISSEDLDGETCSLIYVQVLCGWFLVVCDSYPIVISDLLVQFVEILEEPLKGWNYISWPQFEQWFARYTMSVWPNK